MKLTALGSLAAALVLTAPVCAQTVTPPSPVVPSSAIPAASPQTGNPVRFNLTLSGRLVADGASSGTIVVTGFDRWGKPARKDAPVTVTVSSGSLLLREAGADPAKVRAQERVESKLDADGKLTLNAYATMIPGPVRLTAIADGAVTDGITSATVYVDPYVRDPVVVGIASAGIGSVPGDVNGSDIWDNGDSNKGRLGLYGTGKIADKTSATFAYESANELSPSYAFGQYTFDPNERPYLTYGDDSTRSVDALSQGHFFGRIDRGLDSFMYGEFDAQTGAPSAAGTFQGLLSGFKLHLSNGSGTDSLTLFTASDNVLFGRRTFNPLGLSTVSTELAPNLIVGSDIVTLVSLDRQSGAVVSQLTYVRNVDYAINYSTGDIRFITIPLPYDANFNPQVVVVQFQYDGTGHDAATTGGSGRVSIGQTTSFEAGYANNVTGGANEAVSSERLHGTLGAGDWTIYHAASSVGEGSALLDSQRNGDNLHIDANVPDGANRFYLLYDWTSPYFNNFYGGFTSDGLIDERAGFEHRFVKDGLLTLQYTRDTNQDGANENTLSAVFKTKPSPRFGYTLGLYDRNASGYDAYGGLPVYRYPAPAGLTLAPNPGNLDGSGAQAEVGASWQVTNRVTLAADSMLNLGAAVPAFPAQTNAELSYAFPQGRAYLRQLWAAGPTYPLSTSGSGYGSLAQATHATIFGISRDLSPMTSIDTGYVVEQTNSGSDAYATYGVKQRFILNRYFQGDAFLQSGSGFGTTYGQNNVPGSGYFAQSGTPATFTVFGLDLGYDKAQNVRSALSFQDRIGYQGGTTVNAGASGRISPEFAIAAAVNSSQLFSYSSDDTRVGLAWRPSGTNRVAALLEYENYTGSGSQYFTYGAPSGNTQVLSYDQLYRPTAGLELVGRVAYQIDGDTYYLAHTALFGFRAAQRIGPKADIAAEWQWLSSAQVSGVSQTSFATELGYRIGSSLRIAGGYNFSGSADPALVGKPTRQGLYLTGTTTIDRIFGWGRFVPSSQPADAAK
jgi:hypothetical protein